MHGCIERCVRLFGDVLSLLGVPLKFPVYPPSPLLPPPLHSMHGRHKDKDLLRSNASSNSTGNLTRPTNGSRQNHIKSPKTFKKNFPHHSSPQAPPPPPVPGALPPAAEVSGATASKSSSESISSVQSSSSGKREKLSYAQMTQKKNNQNSSKVQDAANLPEGGGAKTTSPPTSPQTSTTVTPPAPQSTTRSIKSTSTGSLAVDQGLSSGMLVSKSAPTSPTKDSGSVSSI